MAQRHSKRSSVPLILSSFPAPPSHIPFSSVGPPPTSPPTVPLPPLPSSASENEQLLSTKISIPLSDSDSDALSDAGERTEDDDTDSDNRAIINIIPPRHHLSLSQGGLGGIMVTRTTTTTRIDPPKTIQGQTRNDEMTLDELIAITTSHPSPNTSTQPQRTPSPDIVDILSATPRPTLSLPRSHSSGEISKSSRVPAGKRRVVSATTSVYPDGNPYQLSINRNRRQSEGAPTHAKIPSHRHTNNGNELPLSQSMSACYEQKPKRGSEDETAGTAWDGDAINKRQSQIFLQNFAERREESRW